MIHVTSFNLSSSQKMLLFSEISQEQSDSLILKFRKDYDINELDFLKEAITYLSKEYLNLQIVHDEEGNYKQHYVDVELSIDCIDVEDENLDNLIISYLENPFESLVDTPLYKWTILKTETSAILIGAVHHVLLDGTSLFSIIPREIDAYIRCIKDNRKYKPIDYSYETYVKSELEYLNSPQAIEDKNYWTKKLEGYTHDWYSFSNSIFATKEIHLNNFKSNYSPFITALALNFLYLSKSKEKNKSFKELVFDTTVHGRYFNQNDAMGMFVNIIPLRLKYDEEKTFEELMSYTKNVLKEGLKHAKLQFDGYSAELKNNNIEPESISMYSIVSNSTDYDAKYITVHEDAEFPLHLRINKDYSDKQGLQSILIEYDKACFNEDEINKMAITIKDLLNQLSYTTNKKCKEYHVEIIDFFKAENYYNNLINSFDNPTTLPSDVQEVNNNHEEFFTDFDFNLIRNLSNKYNTTIEKVILSIFMLNLSKFSSSKDVLIAYNNQACGYHFEKNINLYEYPTEFEKKFENYPDYPLSNNRKLKFNPEIAFQNKDCINEDYKLLLSYDKSKIKIKYDTSYYSENFIKTFVDSMRILFEKLAS